AACRCRDWSRPASLFTHDISRQGSKALKLPNSLNSTAFPWELELELRGEL
ncbi:Uncharacterized protein DAT39_005128, partial [Clarias magur]